MADTQPTDASFLEDVCLQPLDEGTDCPAGKQHLQFFFNKEVEECVSFMHKGCGGNKNRFSLQDDCTDSCQVEWYRIKNKKKKSGATDDDQVKRTADDCKAPPEVGPCRALIPQWHFDGASKQCKKFNYGGCKGNKNRFNTEDQCKAVCAGQKSG